MQVLVEAGFEHINFGLVRLVHNPALQQSLHSVLQLRFGAGLVLTTQRQR